MIKLSQKGQLIILLYNIIMIFLTLFIIFSKVFSSKLLIIVPALLLILGNIGCYFLLKKVKSYIEKIDNLNEKTKQNYENQKKQDSNAKSVYLNFNQFKELNKNKVLYVDGVGSIKLKGADEHLMENNQK